LLRYDFHRLDAVPVAVVHNYRYQNSVENSRPNTFGLFTPYFGMCNVDVHVLRVEDVCIYKINFLKIQKFVILSCFGSHTMNILLCMVGHECWE